MLFPVFNIEFRKGEEWIIIAGQIRNDSHKNFSLAVFKLILFNKKIPIGSSVIKIRHFRSKTIKSFERTLVGISYTLIPSIDRCDIMLESGT